jgi:hypothetical protein
MGSEIIGQDVFGKVRLALIEIAGDQIDRQHAAPLQIHQQRQKPVGILAARQRNQPARRLPLSASAGATMAKSSIAWRTLRISRLRSLLNDTLDGASA